MFADKKSHSPESAASGVKQAMFVDFRMWLRYARKSLNTEKTIQEVSTRDAEGTYLIAVLTLTLFSHSNSVHILRNYSWA